MRKITEDEKYLRGIALPEKTRTYEPLGHGVQIDVLLEEVDRAGFAVDQDLSFVHAQDGQIMTGVMNLLHPDATDPDIGIKLGFMNSLNKQRPASIAIGGNVFICTNGMFIGEHVLRKKHCNGVFEEYQSYARETLKFTGDHYLEVLDHKGLMQDITINETKSAELAGRLFWQEEVITGQQLKLLRGEVKNSKNFGMDENGYLSLWDFYNNVTETLKISHAKTYIQDHIRLHDFVTYEFEL